MKPINLICYQLPMSELNSLKSLDMGKYNINLIGLYDELPEFLSSITTTSPDIILLNSLTETSNCFELLNELNIIAPISKKILYTTFHSQFLIEELKALGVNHVIHKRVQGENLLKQILVEVNIQ